MKRDLEQIKQRLDLEIVLQHYGYKLVKKKSSENSKLYQKGEQRLIVKINGANTVKLFADLQNAAFKGDLFAFLSHFEQGNYRQIFNVIDQLLNDGVGEEQETRHNAQEAKKSSKLYQTEPLTEIGYLQKRALLPEIIFSENFRGRIFNVTIGQSHYKNTAFPMYDREGRLRSMEIRNVDFKAFPEGERGEALWLSNSFVDNDGSVLPFHRIVLAESAIDALSFKQLNPEQHDERRLYVATAGQPNAKQQDFIQELLRQNPQAQLVIAQDGDAAGLRFALNYLALAHPSENPQLKISPNIRYVVSGKQNSDGIYHLALQICYPLAQGVRKAQHTNETLIMQLSQHIQPNHLENAIDANMTHLITRASFQFQNHEPLLRQALFDIVWAIEQRQGQKLFELLLPTAAQKDFNDVLKTQNGKPLPNNHGLKLPDWPIIQPYKPATNKPKRPDEGMIF